MNYCNFVNCFKILYCSKTAIKILKNVKDVLSLNIPVCTEN